MNTLGKIIIIVNLIMVAIVFILERKSFKSFALWFFVIIVFPIVGFLIYIIFGNRLKFRAKRLLLKKYKSTKNYIKYCSWYEKYKKNNKNGLNNKKNSLIKYMLNNFNCNLWHNNSIKFYNNGKDFLHDLIKDLRFAKKTIFLEFYIFADDEVGIMLAEILKLKARCGVDVRLIIDAVGSRKTKKVFLRELKDAGVKVCKFFPPLFSLSFLNLKVNYRNHRKIAVIDGKVGYTGGINIRDDHMGKDKRLYPWKDSAIRLFGSATYDLTDIFLNDWNFSTGEETTNVDLAFPKIDKRVGECVQILESGPEKRVRTIKNAYIKIIKEAKEFLIIETPYFIVDTDVLNLLVEAKRRGVDVKVLLPKRPDKRLVYAYTLRTIKDLLLNDIDVFLYKGFLHSKVLISENVLSLGSCNFDNRSFDLNFELTALLYDNVLISRQVEAMNIDMKNSILLDKSRYCKLIKKYRLSNLMYKLIYKIL